jgi:hypothetical protein
MMRWWVVACAAAAAAFAPAAVRARPRVGLRRRGAGDADADVGALDREELEALVGALRGENGALRARLAALGGGAPAAAVRFDFGVAALCAGFAFASYNDPDGARWERGGDGCDVAFRSASFVRRCYGGCVVARVLRARDLPGAPFDAREVALTGPASDPYAKLALVERFARTSQRFRARNATDIARTETVWRGGGGPEVVWPRNDGSVLYAGDVARASSAPRRPGEEGVSESFL